MNLNWTTINVPLICHFFFNLALFSRKGEKNCAVRVWRSQTLYQTLYRVEKGSGGMAVPKLFYFPNSGSGQLKYFRTRVHPHNWAQGSNMDDIRDSAAIAVSKLGWEKLKELQLNLYKLKNHRGHFSWG